MRYATFAPKSRFNDAKSAISQPMKGNDQESDPDETMLPHHERYTTDRHGDKDEVAHELQEEGLNTHIARLISLEMMPYRLVESEAFKALMDYAVPRYELPSRHFFSRNAIPALHQHVKECIVHALRQSVSTKVHLTTDAWTSRHGQGRYVSITAHWVNVVDAGSTGDSKFGTVLPSSRSRKQLAVAVRTPSSSSSSSCRSESSSTDRNRTTTPSTAATVAHQVSHYGAATGKRQQAVLAMKCLGDNRHTAEVLSEFLQKETHILFHLLAAPTAERTRDPPIKVMNIHLSPFPGHMITESCWKPEQDSGMVHGEVLSDTVRYLKVSVSDSIGRYPKSIGYRRYRYPIPIQVNGTPSNGRSIILKPADKGGAIVVMNRVQYIHEITRQLSDTTTYGVIPRDPVATISNKIHRVIDTYRKSHIIDQKTATYLLNPHPVTPVFYVLPKIHKSLQNPPGRPIVASTDSILSPLSIFLEKIMTPLIKETRSFLLDTGHFLKVINQLGTIPPDSTLVTMDVNSLYTSIQHTKGIEATRYLLHQSSLSGEAIQFCLDLLHLVLYENYFLFEDTFYIQKCGTAMGSNVAPAYANAFMNHFETTYVFNNNLFLQFATGYHRYIDDIFLVWTGTLDSLKSFHVFLNSIFPELQFTMHHNTESVPFLDTMVLKDNEGHLSTDIYCKPTDCNSLLHYTSCHPRTMKNSLPRSQFNRVARIVSNFTILNDRLDTMAKKISVKMLSS
ncbi:unnamed protein product [Ranitomeya imitator]|uniref:Reverse transcriptase domain-containing protein n=1 Tax=Ranitomeya imitator TaxID=111125 RepID=A0ABN9ML16_9NEOB|nr:unnamed protein product [Ranitomeya imitator]